MTFEKETDSLYIYLLEGVYQRKTVRLTDEITLDNAEGERLAGIEILDANNTQIKYKVLKGFTNEQLAPKAVRNWNSK